MQTTQRLVACSKLREAVEKLFKIDINLLCIKCNLHEGRLNNCIAGSK